MAKTTSNTLDASSKKKTSNSEKKSQQEKKARASAQNDEKQQRKEQAKQEAKLMLEAEQAKKDVQKAEQKLAKAQTRLEDARTQQQKIEQKLAKLRSPQQEEVSHNGIPAISDEPLTTFAQTEDILVMDDTSLPLTTPFIEQSAETTDTTTAEAEDTTATPGTAGDNTVATDLEPEQLPAEGRTDISDASQEQDTSTATEASGEETSSAQPVVADSSDFQISSDNVSMPLLSDDANTWPPPLIREEVAEAAHEVEASDHNE